jgi:SAM-dependent methyltransferase
VVSKVANADQLRSWDGDDGDHWTENVDHYEAAVRPHYERMREAAAIGPAERALDIGCGCGESTIDAGRSASRGSALGVDLSSRMLVYARERARAIGITNATFEQADAQVHPFDAGVYDIAISRTGGMFFADPVEAYANIGRSLRPGGRLVLLAWQGIERNEWIREIQGALAAGRDMQPPPPNAPGPFSLSDPPTVRRILEAAGFTDVQLEAVNKPFQFGTDADDAFRFMSGSGIAHGMLDNADEATRTKAFNNLRATFAAHDTGQGVVYDSNAWIITARKPLN